MQNNPNNNYGSQNNPPQQNSGFNPNPNGGQNSQNPQPQQQFGNQHQFTQSPQQQLGNQQYPQQPLQNSNQRFSQPQQQSLQQNQQFSQRPQQYQNQFNQQRTQIRQQPKRKKGLSKISIFLIAAVVVIIGFLGFSFIQQKNYQTALTAVDSRNTNYVKVNFTSGSTVSQFATKMKNKGLIRDSKVFVEYFVQQGDTSVQAGEYYVQKSMSVADIYKLLKSGPNVTVAHEQFIKSRSEYAQEMQKKYGIFTSINLAQTILESEWGQSTLASKYNNYYGIKAIGSQKSVTLSTKEYLNGSWTTVKSKFAVYDSWKTGMEAHTKFLIDGTSSNPDQFADVKAAKTYQAQAHALVIDGYATDPTYESKLLEIISTWNLTQYDA